MMFLIALLTIWQAPFNFPPSRESGTRAKVNPTEIVPGQIFGRVEAVSVDHEVPVREINFRRLAPVLSVEEFRQSPLLDRVDGVVVEPRAGKKSQNEVSSFLGQA